MAKGKKSGPKMGGSSGHSVMGEVQWSGSMKNQVNGNTGKAGSISQR